MFGNVELAHNGDSLIHSTTSCTGVAFGCDSQLSKSGLIKSVKNAISMSCSNGGTHGERARGRKSSGCRHNRINQDFHAFRSGDIGLDWRIEGQDCLVPAQEVVNGATRLVESLSGLSSQLDLGVLVLIDVVDSDHIVIRWDVSHYEILLKSSGKYRIPAIIDVLTDNVDTTGSSAVEFGANSVEISKAAEEVLIPRLVLLCDGVIDVLVNARELLHDRH